MAGSGRGDGDGSSGWGLISARRKFSSTPARRGLVGSSRGGLYPSFIVRRHTHLFACLILKKKGEVKLLVSLIKASWFVCVCDSNLVGNEERWFRAGCARRSPATRAGFTYLVCMPAVLVPPCRDVGTRLRHVSALHIFMYANRGDSYMCANSAGLFAAPGWLPSVMAKIVRLVQAHEGRTVGQATDSIESAAASFVGASSSFMEACCLCQLQAPCELVVRSRCRHV